MWGLIKTLFAVALLAVLVYTLFFFTVAGKTLAAHGVEVWRSPVLEEKRDIIKDALKQELEERLAAERGQSGRGLTHGLTRDDLTHEDLTDADRQALTEMLRQKSR